MGCVEFGQLSKLEEVRLTQPYAAVLALSLQTSSVSAAPVPAPVRAPVTAPVCPEMGSGAASLLLLLLASLAWPTRGLERPSRDLERPTRSLERPTRSLERPTKGRVPFRPGPSLDLVEGDMVVLDTQGEGGARLRVDNLKYQYNQILGHQLLSTEPTKL